MKSDVLNLEEALSKLDNSFKLYEIILTGYADKHSDVQSELEVLAAKGDFERAYRLIHSIKGLCGNLGADRLREIAVRLEKEYKENRLDAALLAEFAREQNRVVAEIRRLLDDASAAE